MLVHKSRLTILALAAVLAGCGGGASQNDPAASTAEPEQTAQASQEVNMVQPGAPGEPSRKATPVATPKGGGFVPADVEFMQNMIKHHEQALVMTALVPQNGSNTSIRVMAKRMEVSQQDESALMKKWLTDRNHKTEAEHADHAMMPGMLTPEQLAQLKAAKGKAFDKLFLQFMTHHHEGALQMVQQLVFDGGGAETEIATFINHVDSDQGIEILRMAELAKKL
jgi:uncharacterized protein (DUF305 family)